MSHLPRWLTTVFVNEWAGSAPTLTAPANAAVLDDTTPDFSWSAVAGATKYHIQIDDNSDFSSPVVDDATLTTNSYTPGSALSFGVLYWRVLAVNAGGAAGTWSAAQTFVIPQLTFTQSVGAEEVTDGGLENWTSATNLTSWTESIAGTSTVNRDGADKHSGSYAARLDIDASNNLALISQALGADFLIDEEAEVVFWAKSSVASSSARCDLEGTGSTHILTNSWAQRTVILRASAGNPGLSFFRSSANRSYFFDDISAKKLSKNAQQVALADGSNVLTITSLFASPYAGQRYELRFREHATTPARDHNRLILIRNDANTAWALQLRKRVNGVDSTPTGWTDITDVGTPDAIRVDASGDQLVCYTRASGLWTQRGAAITETNQQTALGVRAVYSSGADVGALYQSFLV